MTRFFSLGSVSGTPVTLQYLLSKSFLWLSVFSFEFTREQHGG